MAEFFEVISKSGPHIYHSALQLVPQSSIIRKLYNQQIYSPISKVVTGIPASWDICTASMGSVWGFTEVAWSPSGQFIAVTFKSLVQIRDSNILERVFDLTPPSSLWGLVPVYPTFSPDGCLVACFYIWCKNTFLSTDIHTYPGTQAKWIPM